MAGSNADFKDLRRRLDRLNCLHPHTKALVLSQAQSLSRKELRDYVDRRISFVERYFMPIDSPCFRDLCADVNRIEDPQDILTHFSMDQTFEPSQWLSYAIDLRGTIAPCLYCVANYAVLGFGKLDGKDEAIVRILLVRPQVLILG